MSNTLVLRGKIAFISFNLDDVDKLKTRKLLKIKDRWVKSKAIINMPLSTYKTIGIHINNGVGNPDYMPYHIPTLWHVRNQFVQFVVSPHSFYTSLHDYQVYANISIRLYEDDDRHEHMVTLL